jgi:hypothetical protein
VRALRTSSPLLLLTTAALLLQATGAAAPPQQATPAASAIAAPLTPAALLPLLEAHKVRNLDEVPALLPDAVLRNFVLKHGVHRTGERGHLSERQVSQSASPEAPRAILWDERSGMVLSYNGGQKNQTNGQRLDWQAFDPKTRAFHLEAIDFPIEAGNAKAYGKDGGADCVTCHGPLERPIFSMYPDWPAFYGSDNDELSSTKVAVQAAEHHDYEAFRKGLGATSARYTPLFDAARVKRTAGVDIYAFWPYRPDLDEKITAPSRAFAFRPGLRLGVVLNRLQAQMLAARIEAHPTFPKLGTLFLHELLQCPSSPAAARTHAERVGEALGEKGPPTALLHEGLVHYRKLLALWGLTVADVDIRFAYPNPAYGSDDARGKPMGVGYIGRYWNAYFDGASTIDELVAYLLWEHLAKTDPKVRALDAAGGLRENSLTRKYGHIQSRYAFDQTFFWSVDTRSPWIPIPYPKELEAPHHRQGFPAELREQHQKACAALE